MQSGPSKEILPIAGVTGYQACQKRCFQFPQFVSPALSRTKTEGSTLTKSVSSYGLSILSRLDKEESFSQHSVDSLLPKIAGILSEMETYNELQLETTDVNLSPKQKYCLLRNVVLQRNKYKLIG